MIQVTAQMRILVAVQPADFRRGIDGLARMAREALASDPFSGCVFVFRNRRATAVKILVYDGQGFWLCHKRLSKGRFRFWPSGREVRSRRLEAHELQVLLSAGDFEATAAAAPWQFICGSKLPGRYAASCGCTFLSFAGRALLVGEAPTSRALCRGEGDGRDARAPRRAHEVARSVTVPAGVPGLG